MLPTAFLGNSQVNQCYASSLKNEKLAKRWGPQLNGYMGYQMGYNGVWDGRSPKA